MLQHYLQIFKKLSVPKLLNFIGLWIGFHLSKLLKRPVLIGLPFSLSIEPTTSCNLRCPQCPSGLRSFTRPIGMLSIVEFEKKIQQFKSHLISIMFYFQGEPFLNPDFLMMVKMASKFRIYTITSTNAHFITEIVAKEIVESGLNKLIISIDGSTQETYQDYRVGGNVEKVLEGTRLIVKEKNKTKSTHLWIVWQFVVFKTNEHQIHEIKRLAEEYGVDELTIKTAQIYDFEQAHHLIPENSSYSRYILKNGKYQIRNKLLNQCWRMWTSCVITWDGKIVPCCFDKDAKYQIGKLGVSNFKSIWRSEPYQNFRRSLLRSRKEIDICTNCSEGTKIWAD